MRALRTRHGEIPLPAFLPDATRGCVRGLDSADVMAAQVDAVVANAYHLMLKPGARLIQSFGGLHAFIGWDRPVLVDSGGFQVFSLIRERPNMGAIRKDEVIFRSPYDGRKTVLTPRKCIEVQFHLGADILMCLDDCTHADEASAEQAAAVDRTIRWARQCRETFDALIDSDSPQRHRKHREQLQRPTSNIECPTSDANAAAGTQTDTSQSPPPDLRHPTPTAHPQSAIPLPQSDRPLLFAIIQGGLDLDLRKRCAEALVEIGFDGYGLGGWPLDPQGRLLTEMLRFVSDLMPADKPKYAMGIGKPENVVACARMGYTMFDCVIPTRDARHHHVFAFTADSLEGIDLGRPDFYERLNLIKGRFAADDRPISSFCDCPACRSYSRAYLRHLFQVGDSLAGRLASIHNLRFYTMLMDAIRRRETCT